LNYNLLQNVFNAQHLQKVAVSGNNLVIGNAKLSLGISGDYSHTWEGTVMCLELIRRSLAMILLRKPDATEVLIIYSFLEG